jgi:hypothetical protein
LSPVTSNRLLRAAEDAGCGAVNESDPEMSSSIGVEYASLATDIPSITISKRVHILPSGREKPFFITV